MNAQQLKNAILQEAIEGRLVKQDPNDEPASALLQRIREEKKQLYDVGLLKKSDLKERDILDEEVPFSLPKGWVWTKIDNIAFVTKLAGFEYSEYIANNLVSKENGIPLFKGKNVQNGKIVYEFEAYIPLKLSNELKRSQINKKCLLTPYVGTIGNIGIHNKEGIFHLGSNVGKIEFYNGNHVNVLEEFAKYFFMSRCGYQELTKYKKATAQESISIEAIRDVFIPLPPVQEQKRIVDKISAAFIKVEEYGKAQEKLNKLNEELPERLKKSILQEAIEGHLVPQDPNDEPASALLNRIREEKKQLLKAGKLKKKDLIETPINEDEIPFEIPDSWKWVRLISLSKAIHYGYTASAATNGNSKLLRITDIQIDKVNWSTVPFCSIKEKDLETYQLHNRDILIARTGGTIGKTYVVRDLNDVAVFASYLIRAIPLESVYEEYIKHFMGSPYYWSQLTDATSGTGQPNVNGQSLSNLIVPLPPLAEQHRIVAKLEQLLGEIDKMKV